MMRLASALGLVIFSSALLILSLICYVSIKKDFLLGASRYRPNGGPRMYMFHTGYRPRKPDLSSQMALKYLDPFFRTQTNAPIEDLKNSSKWRHNSTAFIQQRKEISQYINISRNFTLTRSVVRIGQLMHFDYSSHNGILTGSHCGEQIEKFDFVFRCNFAPTEVFKRDVGRRTNMTTFNPSILEKYYNNLLTVQDRNNFFLSLKKMDGAILWIPAFFFHTSATVTRPLVDFFVEHRDRLKVQLAWPGNIIRHINNYWKTKQLSPKRLSTGILMYTLASSMCDQIHLYGFWPFGWDPNTGKELPYHYYDRKGTKFSTQWQAIHQLPAEFKLLYKMHTEGLLKLSISHCA
ncbi:alpha-N-acetylneuraminate alpha-2,8-sialyltransferase ST8SIA3 isoform X3 [Stigmatopora nigra]